MDYLLLLEPFMRRLTEGNAPFFREKYYLGYAGAHSGISFTFILNNHSMGYLFHPLT
jgi:hypothetical protein